METLLGVISPANSQNYRQLSALDLAFVGDGVYDLLAREQLLLGGSCPVKKLHQRKTAWVCCSAQAAALRALWPSLTQEEQAVALRGRNAHVGHVPKNASTADYHGATALETLFGWLYLAGETGRVRELFAMSLEGVERQNGSAETT